MAHYVGLDVSLKETSICVKDGSGKTVREGKVATAVEAIAEFLRAFAPQAERIGIETGSMTTHLFHGLRKLGFPVVCICARDAKPLLARRINKTDRNDAAGIAELMRLGAYKEVHVKALETHEDRALLSGRALLVKMRRDIENQVRGLLKTFGLKVGQVSEGKFDPRVRELAGAEAGLFAAVAPLLAARIEIRAQIRRLERLLSARVRGDEVCRHLMSADGIGPVTALAYRTVVEDPHRFARSASVGAYVGLTPRRFNSGEIDFTGRISKRGDAMLRTLLFEAAGVLLTRTQKRSALQAWGLRLARKIGFKRAKLAVARKLAVILHRMWADGTTFERKAGKAA